MRGSGGEVDEVVWSALDRYFAGRCSADEAELVRAWATDPVHAIELSQARQVWEAAAAAPPRFDAEAAVVALRAARAGVRRTDVLPLPRARTPFRAAVVRGTAPSWIGALVAAGIVAAVGVAGWWIGTQALPSHPRPAAEPPMHVYATTRGQRAEVMLVDGTRVWLSVDSRLRVPESYGARSRMVYLEGEGYFAVRHDARHPFAVRTASAIAEDVGTEFLVRAYGGERGATVAVAEGSVSLRPGATDITADSATASARGVTLTPGQMAELDSSGTLTVTPGVDVQAMLGWRDGRLELRRVPLERAAREIERWYDVHIVVPDSALARVSVTASFTNQSLDEVLGVLARTLGARYTRRGDEVRLMSGP